MLYRALQVAIHFVRCPVLTSISALRRNILLIPPLVRDGPLRSTFDSSSAVTLGLRSRWSPWARSVTVLRCRLACEASRARYLLARSHGRTLMGTDALKRLQRHLLETVTLLPLLLSPRPAVRRVDCARSSATPNPVTLLLGSQGGACRARPAAPHCYAGCCL